jgi:hypothetical protein
VDLAFSLRPTFEVGLGEKTNARSIRALGTGKHSVLVYTRMCAATRAAIEGMGDRAEEARES